MKTNIPEKILMKKMINIINGMDMRKKIGRMKKDKNHSKNSQFNKSKLIKILTKMKFLNSYCVQLVRN